jgi:GMP synthase (glutamine-hydrolysing)
VKAGSTFPALAASLGDFEDWIAAGLGAPDRVEVCCPPAGDPLPEPAGYAGIVVSGSHANVTDRDPWSEATTAWLRGALDAGVPLLGICYGHQLLAEAAGGRVGDNPAGREFGTAEIRVRREGEWDPLLGGFPVAVRAHVCHAQSVLALPPGAILLASSIRDPHQAFRLGRRAWGVQFHPEFSLDAARAYVRECAADLRAEGQDPDALEAGLADTPEARRLLRRFGEMVR